MKCDCCEQFRTFVRTFARVPLSALVLLFICCVFVISQYPLNYNIRYISDDSKSTFVMLDNQKRDKSESLLSVDKRQPEPDTPPPNWPKPPRWTYKCINYACVRREVDENEPIQIHTLDVCWLTCGPHGSVWPFPKYQKSGGETIKFVPTNIRLAKTSAPSEKVKQLMEDAYQIKHTYFKNFPGLNAKTNSSPKYGFFWPFGNEKDPKSVFEDNIVELWISCNSSEEIFTLATDESYEISIDETTSSSSTTNEIHLSVFINAETFFGIRHGLETLSQLIALDASGESLQILKSYHAKDKPKFPYRGVLIDSARNFVPMDILKRIVDGMSYNKLNILHLHLSDSNSFTFHSNRVPQMTQYGALSENHIYFPHEMQQLVNYARIRGVKIIPELDTPSHAGNGWQFGKKLGMGDLAFYINTYTDSWKQWCGQPPCGILNPVNTHVYDVLERLYTDMFEVFDKDIFHMGGDEVNTESWSRQSELRSWMVKNKSYGIGLWRFFQGQAFERLQKHSENVTAILWTSSLTEEETKTNFLDPTKYIIQVWDSSNSRRVTSLVNKGFSLIISYVDKFYLDWGEGTWLGKEQNWPYHNWQVFYDTKIGNGNKILGAETPLWSEKTGPWQVEVKLWPRAAAFAENVWSDPPKRTDGVYSRLNYHNHRMQQRSIPTGQLQPESCLHFNGHCKNPQDVI